MKKSLKILISVIIVLIVLWGIIFFIDYSRCSHFKEPIFVVAGVTADDGGSGTYYGLGYKVKIEKTISAEYGPTLVKVEMYMFDKFITGAIAETHEENYSSNTTAPYIPDGMDITDGNEGKIPANEVKYNRDAKNVTIEVLEDTITKETVEILITDNNEDKYGWGVEFKVQEKINGEWVDLKYVSDNVSWIEIAYLPNENNQLTQNLNIKEYYGKLSTGTYRIVKPVYDNGYIHLYSNEFEIK